MDNSSGQTTLRKTKTKKASTKTKTAKKRKCEGPSCSMFLTELSRKLALKQKEEEEKPKNIVQAIIDSLTNALPIKFTKRSPKVESPIQINAQIISPCIEPSIPPPSPPPLNNEDPPIMPLQETEVTTTLAFKMPKMPLLSAEDVRIAIEKRKRKYTYQDASVNTSAEHDVAVSIAKHVGTLKKISLIAEEFNQKTAKNLKEIVDSVQADLIKKLEEAKTGEKESKDVTTTMPSVIEEIKEFD